MRVLLVSHAYIAPENRRKPALLGGFSDMEMAILCPTHWQAMGRPLRFTQVAGDRQAHWTFTSNVFSPGDGARYLYDPVRVNSILGEFKPDLIHVEEEPWSLSLGELSLFSRFKKIKTIFFTWENLEIPRSPWQMMVQKISYRQAEMALAGSSGAKKILEKTGFRKRIEVLAQFGADTARFHPVAPEKREQLRSHYDLDGFVVGFVGRFTASKGVGVLLRAAKELKEALPQVTFLLVSTTLFPKKFSDLADDLGVRSCLRVADSIPHEAIPEYMQSMDALVLPSITTPTWKEQFGRVLPEAMACRVPVIGSSSGAIPEVVGEAGLIFEEGNAHDLAEKISSLVNNGKLRLSLAQSGFDRVRQEYSFEIIAERTYRIYKDILS